MTLNEKKQLQIEACKVRIGIIEATHSAKSGHPGGAMSSAELLTYLYHREMRIDPKKPKWNERDRFVLSKGHSSPGLYSVLANLGFFPVEDLLSFRNIDSYLQGHPNMNSVPGVDMSTGSLGQGLSVAVGMSLGLRQIKQTARVYVLVGDGEIQEGQIWEACMAASHYNLDNLCVIIDNNNLQIDGSVVDVMNPYPIKEKLEAFGFFVQQIDGHDFDAIEDAFNKAKCTKGKPSAILLKTVKGKGVSFMENIVGWHSKAPNDAEYNQAILELTNQIAKLEA